MKKLSFNFERQLKYLNILFMTIILDTFKNLNIPNNVFFIHQDIFLQL